jgi:hypothetical protein
LILEALDITLIFWKICHGTPLFSGVCPKTPLNCGFARYHYNFVAYLLEHTALPKMESLSFSRKNYDLTLSKYTQNFSKFRTLTGMPPSHLTRRPAAVSLNVAIPRRPLVRPASPAASYLCLGVAPPLEDFGLHSREPLCWTTLLPAAMDNGLSWCLACNSCLSA